MEFASLIQILLAKFEYVSLPELGSFVKRYEPAKKEGEKFYPPREYYIFDTSRTFDDEALQNYLVEEKGFDLSDAAAKVKEFATSVRENLNKGIEVHFPGIGDLTKDAENIILKLDEDKIASDTFGLDVVEFDFTEKSESKPTEHKEVEKSSVVKPPVTEKPQKAETPIPVREPAKTPVKVTSGKNTSTIVVPIVVIVAIIAITAVVWLVPDLHFWRYINLNPTENVAKVEKSELKTDSVISSTIDQPISSIDSSELTQPSDTTASDAPTHETQSNISEKLSATTNQKLALSYIEQTDKAGDFYIIIGSFSQQQNAQQLVNKYEAKGYKPFIVSSGSSYRVAVYHFTNHDRAMRELERLKAQNDFNQIWLLSQK